MLRIKSCHTKLVKRGMVMSLLDSALKKSCPRKGLSLVDNQVIRLKKAGYSVSMVKGVARRLY